MKREDELDLWADEMLKLLKASPNGVIRDDIMQSVGIPTVGDFHEVKGRLQDRHGVSDTITVVGDSSTAMAGGWTYSLQGDPASPVARSYQLKKVRNIFGRERRSYIVTLALVRGTPGNTAIGKAARRWARGQYRTMEDVADVLVEMGEPAPALPPRV